jgi:hypothetical protein
MVCNNIVVCIVRYPVRSWDPDRMIVDHVITVDESPTNTQTGEKMPETSKGGVIT